MRAITSILVLALLSIIAPVAAADGCVGPICGSSWSDGTPCAEGGFEGGATTIDLAGVGYVSGSWYCAGSTRDDTIRAEAGGVGVQWTRFSYSDPENGEFAQCYLFIGQQFIPCPVDLAPPNPGWGDVPP